MIEHFKLWDGDIPVYTANEECPNNVTAYIHEGGVRPAMVVFAGGSYAKRAPHEGDPIAEFYYDNGFNAFVVDYRVAPNRYPAPLMDAQRAVKLIRLRAEEYGVDPTKVFTIGFSAGGHLCGSVATMEDVCFVGDEADAMDARPNGAILCYPVISSDPAVGHMNSFQNLLGDRFDERDAFSVDACVGEDTCPCFFFHTMDDPLVSVKNSLCLLWALRDRGIAAEAYIAEHGPHGVGLAAELEGAKQWTSLTLDWLKRQMAK